VVTINLAWDRQNSKYYGNELPEIRAGQRFETNLGEPPPGSNPL
jgi:hypothetical protein